MALIISLLLTNEKHSQLEVSPKPATSGTVFALTLMRQLDGRSCDDTLLSTRKNGEDKLCGGSMTEIILDLGPVNTVDETAFAQAIDRLAQWQETRSARAYRNRDAPGVMIKTVSDARGTLRKSVIFQRQEWASAFIGFWEAERAAS